jgi:hypothetical protein
VNLRMPLPLTIIAIAIPIAWFIDFLLGPPGNRRLKDALVQLYVKVEAGTGVFYTDPQHPRYSIL